MSTRDPVEVQKELLSHAFGQAQAYTNVVLGMGYAGFFAIWSFLKPELSKAEVLWSALLVSISLAAFILFEVFQSFLRSRSILGLSQTVADPSKFQAEIEAFRKAERSRVIAQRYVWAVAFLVSVTAGFGAVLILLWAFVRSLFTLYAI